MLMLAFIVLVVAAIWSSAYYDRHYAPIEKALKANASKKINGTESPEAKEALKEWQNSPIRSYFPMQLRYWWPYFCGVLAVIFLGIQHPGRITTVNPECLDNPGDDAELRCCLCQLNAINMLERLAGGGCYIICATLSWAYYVFAATFIENAHENRHMLVPVYSVMLQFFFVTLSVALMLFSRWTAYKEDLAFTRQGMSDDDALDKLV